MQKMRDKETLEEAAIKHSKLIDEFPPLENPIFSFKEGLNGKQREWILKQNYRS
jgi:hypothetical protein